MHASTTSRSECEEPRSGAPDPIARREAVEAELAELTAHIDAATHRQLTKLREFDDIGGWCVHGVRTFPQWLSWRLGMSPAVAREKVRVANALGSLPLLDAALARGEISYSKIRAITRIATTDNEATLLHYARNATAAQLERIIRGFRKVTRDEDDDPPERYVTRYETDDGMIRILAQLHPDEAERVWQALLASAEAGGREAKPTSADTAGDSSNQPASAETPCAANDHPASADTADSNSQSASAEAAEGPNGQSASAEADAVGGTQLASAEAPRTELAKLDQMREHLERERQSPVDWKGRLRLPDALVRLADCTLEGGPTARSAADRTEIYVHLRPDLLDSGEYRAELQDGTPIEAETLRRIACDASLVPAVLDQDGTPLDVGRKTRSIPPAIRRALWLRDAGCCTFPGCTNTQWLHAHHIEHWLHGGETKLSNLCLLCSYHHGLLHEQGYRLEKDAHDELRFMRPDGNVIPRVPSTPRVPQDPVASLRRTHRDAGLHIDAKTNECQWDGRPPQYNWCIGALLPN